MISRILIPTDFSPVATNALRYAIGLAGKAGASLDLLHVNSVPVMDTTFPSEVYQNFMVEIEDATKRSFEKLEDAVLKTCGIPYRIHTTLGFVNDEIIDFAEQNKCELILMGTTGASGIEELLVGSNAASVIGKSKVPVLVIPPTSSFSDIRHMVYSSDFNEPEFPTVNTLVYFSELFESTVSVVHVSTDYDHYFQSENNFFVRNKHKIPFDKWSIVKLDTDNVIEGIEKFIADHRPDMLVMAKHNRSFFDRLFHHSLSREMAYHTRIPLLVLSKD